jgi:hypothetical protein
VEAFTAGRIHCFHDCWQEEQVAIGLTDSFGLVDGIKEKDENVIRVIIHSLNAVGHTR